jgi:hypothetical protein
VGRKRAIEIDKKREEMRATDREEDIEKKREIRTL